MPLDGTLGAFADLTGAWTGILLGNGASRAVCSSFAYQSLFQVAQAPTLANTLSAQAISIFSSSGTTNFERVLWALITAGMVNSILGLQTGPIDNTYANVRQALIEAVHAVHVPWLDVPTDTLVAIRAALREYKFVYSTNYDLLAYWAVMQDQNGFVDYFFGPIFDAANTQIWGRTDTRLLYLHGGLHLSRTSSGTMKRAAGAGGNVLDTFGDPLGELNAVPLFISEGSSANKMASIRSNDYLSFAYGELVNHEGGLVIFGQSMDPAYDQHLISALRGRGSRRLGIAVYRGNRTDVEILNEKTNWLMRFGGLNFAIDFFDSTTHPLGVQTLFVY